MIKKIVNISISDEIYKNLLLSGTVIDRPGLPLLKVIDATSLTDGRVSIAIEVSPYSRKMPKRKKGEL